MNSIFRCLVMMKFGTVKYMYFKLVFYSYIFKIHIRIVNSIFYFNSQKSQYHCEIYL